MDTEYEEELIESDAGERGCGKRQKGGIYVRTLFGRRGLPLEHFLFDPGMPIPDGLEIPNRGIAILERPGMPGVFDLYDRVGKKGYRNPQDFIEEVRRKGLSRRIGQGADFEKLSPQSLIFLIHDHVILKNAQPFYAALHQEVVDYANPARLVCPNPDHAIAKQHEGYPIASWSSKALGGDYTYPTCAGAWRHLIEGGEPSLNPDHKPRTIRREVGDITYSAHHAPHDFRPDYAPGFFLRLPIHRLDIIRDPEGGKDQQAMMQAAKSSLPIQMEDQ